MITFACPACQKKFSVKDELAGKKGKCPGCGQVVAVPPRSPLRRRKATLRRQPGLTVTSGCPDPSAVEQPRRHARGPASRRGHDSSLTDFLAPPQADDELGRLGKYRILKILGHGGMGVVFKAEDPSSNAAWPSRPCCRPWPPAPVPANASCAKPRRWPPSSTITSSASTRSMKNAASPSWPWSSSRANRSTNASNATEKLPLAEVLRIGREIAEGLAAAHATGLIHRDIKPAQHLAGSAAGAASRSSTSAWPAPPRRMPGLTQQGAIVGTPAYMAPEQGRGETVDARCDLFSLGVVLYRLCTGQQPFKGKDTVSTLMAVAMHQPPPPIQLNAELPQELSDLVMKLLEKDPDRRPASAGRWSRCSASPGEGSWHTQKDAVGVEGPRSGEASRREPRRTHAGSVLVARGVLLLALVRWAGGWRPSSSGSRPRTERWSSRSTTPRRRPASRTAS